MELANLVIVFSTCDQEEADAIRNLLRGSGIPCRLAGILRGRAPGTPTLDVQLQVPAALVDAARQVIESQVCVAPVPSLAVRPPAAASS